LKSKNLLLANILIVAFSFSILYFFDWPIEVIGIIGVAWAFISSLEQIRKIKSLARQT